jgi:hypothetical protein
VTEIETALDQAHAKAKAAFAAKDLSTYMGLFSADLAYVQANGRTIDREQLRRDVAAQFRRVSKAESSFVREAIEERGSIAKQGLPDHAGLPGRRVHPTNRRLSGIGDWPRFLLQ